MNWNELKKLSPSEFVKKLRLRPAFFMDYGDFVDLYNSLINDCKKNPARPAELADALAPFLRKRGLPDHALLFDELGARAHMLNGEFIKASAAMLAMVDTDQSEETMEIVLELAHGAMASSRSSEGSVDQRPEIFASMGKVFAKMGRLEELAQVHRGCTEFCVNGFSFMPVAPGPQTGWRSGSVLLSSPVLASSTSY